MTNKRDLPVNLECAICGSSNIVYVVEQDLMEYSFSRPRRHIQDIFPYLSNEERELFISRTCPECWKKMFGGDEDDE